MEAAVSASTDKTLKVWDVENGWQLHTLEGHADSVVGIAVSTDGRRVVSASRDKTLKVWDMKTARQLHTLAGHTASVVGVAVSPDGRHAVSASTDNTLRVWDLESGKFVAAFTADAGVLCCAVDNAQTVIAGDAAGRVHFLSLERLNG